MDVADHGALANHTQLSGAIWEERSRGLEADWTP